MIDKSYKVDVKTQPLLRLWRILPQSIKKSSYPLLVWGILAAVCEIIFAVSLSRLATVALQVSENKIADGYQIFQDPWLLVALVSITAGSLILIKRTFINKTKDSSIKIASYVSNAIFRDLFHSGLPKILSTDNSKLVVLLTKNLDALVDASMIFLKSILSILISGLLALVAFCANPIVTMIMYFSFGIVAYASRYASKDATSNFRQQYEKCIVEQVAILEILLKIPREILLRSDNQYIESLYMEKDSKLRKAVGNYSAGISTQSSIVEVGGISTIFILPVIMMLLATSDTGYNIGIPLICTIKSIPYLNQLVQAKSFNKAYYQILDQTVVALTDIQYCLSNIEDQHKSKATSDDLIRSDWKEIKFNRIKVKLGEDKYISYPDISLQRNSKIAIIGGIGKGKTSLLDLIAGLRMPSEGTILVDGIHFSPHEYSREIRAKCSYLAQKSFVVNGSLQYNIILGNTYTQSKYESAVSSARLERIPLTDPNVVIGSAGIHLSGGQEKKVSLARALYENKDILILDEPTSAFDSRTARELMKTIDALKGKTIIIVTHDIELIPDGFTILDLT